MPAARLLIATPAYGGQITTGYARSVFAAQALMHQRQIDVRYMTVEHSDVVRSRNLIAAKFLEGDFTHLLFVDADMQFSARVVDRLFAADLPVFGCAYPRRAIDLGRLIELARAGKDTPSLMGLAHKFVIKLQAGQKLDVTDGRCRVAGLGMGLCLIRREVFTTLIATKKLVAHAGASHGLNGPLYGFFDYAEAAGEVLSEDLSFCERWRMLCGGEVWALVDEPISHIGPHVFTATYLDRLKAGEW